MKDIDQIPLTMLAGNLQTYEMAFAVIINKVIVESASDNEDSYDDEVPKKLTLQEAYDKLCIEFIKSEKTYHLCRKELNEVKNEKAELLSN